ncbi:hypothetical protein Tco_0417477 [Tanacetum coccineum]
MSRSKSPTFVSRPRAIPNLFRGGKVTSGLSSTMLVESKMQGWFPDDVQLDQVWESIIGGGNGSEWELDHSSSIAQQTDRTSSGDRDNTCIGNYTGSGGDTSSDGDGIRGSGREGILELE